MTRRRKQNIKLALVCAILGAIVLMTIFAPWLAPYDPLEVNMELRLLDPCRAHPLGTDALGRDVLSRVIYGGRASLLLAVVATACSMAWRGASMPYARCAADRSSAVRRIWSFSMRAMSSGHTNWNSKYFAQLRCA